MTDNDCTRNRDKCHKFFLICNPFLIRLATLMILIVQEKMPFNLVSCFLDNTKKCFCGANKTFVEIATNIWLHFFLKKQIITRFHRLSSWRSTIFNRFNSNLFRNFFTAEFEIYISAKFSNWWNYCAMFFYTKN